MSRSAAVRAGRLLGGALLPGAAVLAWSLVEARSPVLRRVDVPVLGPGQAPLRVLHLSDLHLTPRSTRERDWVQGLAALEPDLTVVTGDMLAGGDAIPTVVEALGDLLERPGAFVLGSNDYHAPTPRNPLRYFGGPSKVDRPVVFLPTGDLVDALTGAGWLDLTNTRGRLDVAGRPVRLVGVDDPHIRRDRMPAPEPRGRHDAEEGALRLGVAHAPYRRVLDAMTDDGSDLVLAGHTHGGQVCVPGYGALVTNCDLPTAYAKGLFAWSGTASDGGPADGFAGPRSSWVHVSAGLGTSPYTPVRLACRPEATLLTLVPRR
ncbi:metallophosphoesterase [Aquipuribacter hungaricus]|uniref:Metallophosphoesterase n=1 Tax=Aquipuribacter hungaricus TaxID=545624 RepID=A0ABV7WL15_9MICO